MFHFGSTWITPWIHSKCILIPSKIHVKSNIDQVPSTLVPFTHHLQCVPPFHSICITISNHLMSTFIPLKVHQTSKFGSWHFKNLHVKTTHVHYSKLVPTKGTYQLRTGHEIITRNTKCYIMILNRWLNFLMTTIVVPPHKVSSIGSMLTPYGIT